MVGWHHLLNGHEFEKTPGDSEGQRSLAKVRHKLVTEQQQQVTVTTSGGGEQGAGSAGITSAPAWGCGAGAWLWP